MDDPSSGNLRLPAGGILTRLALLMPTFSLLYSPLLLAVQLLPVHNAPLPIIHKYNAIASVIDFSPGNFRRRVTRLVSYYALFK